MNWMTFAIALGFWFLLATVAITNGYIGNAYFAPKFGEYVSHVYKSIVAIVAIFCFALWYAQLIDGDTWLLTAIGAGLLWVSLTTVFEFVFGHYVFGHSWDKLLADYRILEGRLWLFVLITCAIAPLIMAQLIHAV